MKANLGKIHVLLSYNIQRVIPFDNVQITSTETLLGIVFDSELKFEEHVCKICNIVNQKLANYIGRLQLPITWA